MVGPHNTYEPGPIGIEVVAPNSGTNRLTSTHIVAQDHIRKFHLRELRRHGKFAETYQRVCEGKKGRCGNYLNSNVDDSDSLCPFVKYILVTCSFEYPASEMHVFPLTYLGFSADKECMILTVRRMEYGCQSQKKHVPCFRAWVYGKPLQNPVFLQMMACEAARKSGDW